MHLNETTAKLRNAATQVTLRARIHVSRLKPFVSPLYDRPSDDDVPAVPTSALADAADDEHEGAFAESVLMLQ